MFLQKKTCHIKIKFPIYRTVKFTDSLDLVLFAFQRDFRSYSYFVLKISFWYIEFQFRRDKTCRLERNFSWVSLGKFSHRMRVFGTLENLIDVNIICNSSRGNFLAYNEKTSRSEMFVACDKLKCRCFL